MDEPQCEYRNDYGQRCIHRVGHEGVQLHVCYGYQDPAFAKKPLTEREQLLKLAAEFQRARREFEMRVEAAALEVTSHRETDQQCNRRGFGRRGEGRDRARVHRQNLGKG